MLEKVGSSTRLSGLFTTKSYRPQSTPQIFQDTLSEASRPPFRTIVKGLFTSIKRFFSSLFRCFYFGPSEKASLRHLEKLLAELPQKIRQFHRSKNRKEIQEWWKKEFNGLHLDVREKILLEDVKTRAPNSANADEWARENIENYRSVSLDYVGNLIIQMHGGDQFDPLEELPKFIRAVVNA